MSFQYDFLPPTQPQEASILSPVMFTNFVGHDTDVSQIGLPVYYMTGVHLGKIVRMELVEIQNAKLGRKYARVDRRPLDPPPVVQLKLYEIHTSPAGEREEIEMTYDETQIMGLLCIVELFPAPMPEIKSPKPKRHKKNLYQGQSSSSRTQKTSSLQFSAPAHGAPGVVCPSNGSKLPTELLVGETCIRAGIIDYEGRKSIVFVFPDVSCRIEGDYILRYRAFDLFSWPDDKEIKITAETYGRPFCVYSNNDFPGLSPSTELTKLISRWGFRVHCREQKRRRGKQPASEETPDIHSQNSDEHHHALTADFDTFQGISTMFDA